MTNIIMFKGIHHKHMFESRTMPHLSGISVAVADFMHRIRWQVALADAPVDPYRHLRSKKPRVTPFVGEPHRGTEAILSTFSQAILDQARRARLRAKRRTRGSAPIVRFAMSYLEKGSWTAVPTDKDGGYAICPKESLLQEMHHILATGNYVPTPRLSDTSQELIQEYVAVCRDIAGTDNGLYRALISDVQGDPDRFFHVLQVRVKTHKAQGNIKLRAIHGAAASPIKPAMRLLSSWMAPTLRSLNHLLRDSFDAARRFAQ